MRLSTIALPQEHGAWGIFSESALLGLFLAPSVSGACLLFSSLGLFLAYQPLKVAVSTPPIKEAAIRRPRYEWLFLGLYGSASLLFFLPAAGSLPRTFWVPLVLGALPAGVQWVFILLKKPRTLAGEVCGGIALCALTPLILLAGGWSLERALPVWTILAVRIVSSVFLIRHALRAAKGKPYSPLRVLRVFEAGSLILLILALNQVVPWLAALAFLGLAVRSSFLLRSCHRLKPMQLGLSEMRAGIVYALLVALGYLFGF